jgi:hypothetical protein
VDHRRPEPVQLAPQVADVRLDDLRVPGVIAAPDVAEQLGAAEHAALMPHQVCEQAELGG